MLARGRDQSLETDLVIGLVNNMPPAALRSTEQDFEALLGAASQGRRVRLKYFTLTKERRPAGDRFPPGPHYDTLDTLWGSRQGGHLDGLIVTGTEPVAASVSEEPCWPELARLVDWAASHTLSTMWSCLAAQAAVYRLDGIVRRPLAGKLSGIYTCSKVGEHRLLADAPAAWPVPHSRYNTIDEALLYARGYQILSYAPQVGADSFIKPVDDSLFLFLQGHPEYGPDSLLREYRRDVRRFLLGQRDRYPDLPEHYFPLGTTISLMELREYALANPDIDLLPAFDAAITCIPAHSWEPHAVRLYAGWLNWLARQKSALQGAAEPVPDRLAS